MIYLLDLNYTLVENSHEKASPFIRQIERERYRQSIIDALKWYCVFLLTARPDKYKDATISSIQSKTGWKPDKSYFNSYGLPPPKAKEMMLAEIRIEYPHETFYGIESNPATRAMYADQGVKSATWKDWLHEHSA